ncbi:MAG TPA: glycosyltransferase family 4 protein [Steroidobacteraceae bacterium]|nr:glycosyltransferase family 4 protein [Steroidobacteraceae bacterium]
MPSASLTKNESLPAASPAVRRRVCIVQRIVPHYRVQFFRALHASLARSGVDLHLIHGQEAPGTVPRGARFEETWAFRIQNHYIRIARHELIWQSCPFQELATSDLVIVEHANRLLLNYPLLAARSKGRRVAFWGHGANFQARGQQSARNTITRNLARAVDWWFAYTNGGARLVESYGYPRERMTVVNNSIDSHGIARAIAGIGDEASALLRERLRLNRPGVAVFCGRLVKEKRLDLLWDAARKIRQRCAHFSLLVIGDGPLEPEVRHMAGSHDWIHYIGATSGEDLAPYFAVSDFMLIPGLVGLVVVDAFAAGLPLVTTRIDTHSPEIEYLEPGVNGLVAEPDDESLATACLELLESPQMLERLRAGCRESSRVYTLEAMVERFAGGVLDALEHKL